MADLITRIADAISPSKFLPYMVERTATLSAFVRSGIVQRTSEFDALAGSVGGTKQGGGIQMPFWTDLSGAADIISGAGTGQDSGKIDGTKKDIAVKQGRRKKWAVGDLVKFIADTADPLTIIGDLMGEYWSREDQALLIASLKGVFAAASMSGSILDIFNESASSADQDTQTLNGNTVLDACQLLGDAKGKLTGIAAHSATVTWLSKLDLIEFAPDSDGKPTIPMFQGKRVIEDDSMPVRAGTTDGSVYTTYFFGLGALAHGEQDLSGVSVAGGFGSYGAELSRDANAEDSFVHFRRLFLMHPRGVAFTGTPAGEFPTNAELATGTNWVRKYEQKNIRLVAVNHNIG